MTGRTIGKYRILEKLGRGGMGTVYKAVDETLGREVAVKVLNPEMADTDVMKRFEVEARTLATLGLPEIATIYEIQHTASNVLMVMELVRGETLDQLLQRSGTLPPERAAYLIAQVLGALAHAHAVGVVHRDLKPSNIMVTELGGVKILDFGVARVAGAAQMTAVALMVGTPDYMSPERILGDEVDGRANLYSVGVLFYRLLTNTLPFQAASPTEMVERQLSEVPTPARVYRPDLPDWCEDVLRRALAKAPADRFQTAEAFRSALLGSIARAANEQTGVYRAIPSESSVAPSPAAAVAVQPTPTLFDAPGPTIMTPTLPVFPAGVVSADAVSRASAIEAGAEATMARVGPTGLIATAVASGELAPAVLSSADPPTAFEPAGLEPTVLAPTVPVPIASAPTGTTLIMKRKQFAIASALLGALALGVVVLAVIVLNRSVTVVVAPPAPTETQQLAGATASPAPTAVAPAAVPPPLEIADPPIRTSPVEAPPPAPGTARPTARGATPSDPSTLAATPPRATNPAPFTFDAKAVVVDGDKHRERDAIVLVADGALTVSQKGDQVLYVISVAELTGLTYSSSKQPLWSSPDGPAEAMKVESGAFGFLKGGRNWLGLRTNDSFLVLRVDDDAVGRVIAGLQDRTGLPVARLIEPKE